MSEFDELIRDAPEFWCMQPDQLVPYAYGMFALINVLKADNAKLREEIEAAKHDLSLFSGELVASKLENAKLRQLCKELLDLCYDAYEQEWGWDDDWALAYGQAKKLGVEVGE